MALTLEDIAMELQRLIAELTVLQYSLEETIPTALSSIARPALRLVKLAENGLNSAPDVSKVLVTGSTSKIDKPGTIRVLIVNDEDGLLLDQRIDW